MKKLTFVLVALLALAFTGCKTETSKVTIYVDDTTGAPVNSRYVFYTDAASYIIGAVLPSPEELITDTEDCWEVAQTNAQGTVTLNISLSVAKLTYYFEVYDFGANQWKEQSIELHRGNNADIRFTVNK